jgi:hypothetical protein
MLNGLFQMKRLYPIKEDAVYNNLIPLKDWAEKYGYSVSNTRKFLTKGQLNGYRYARKWWIEDRALPHISSR